MNLREEIKKNALVFFRRRGLRSVRMEDIAQEMGISKRTIYQHFNSKEELVADIMTSLNLQMDHQINYILNDKVMNPVLKLLTFYSFRFNVSLQFNPVFMYDLKNNYHTAELIYDHMITKIKERLIIPILKELKEGGYLYDKANVTLIFIYHEALFNTLFEEYNSILNQFSKSDVFELIFTKNMESIIKTENRNILSDFCFESSIDFFDFDQYGLNLI